MGQVHINSLNKTVTNPSHAQGGSTTDSLSVRLVGLQEGVELYGIAWGLGTQGVATFIRGKLYIIRNEVYDDNFAYGAFDLPARKDVVFEDKINIYDPFRYRDFAKPMKLADAQNFVIVVCNVFDESVLDPGTLITSLTVRGDYIKAGEAGSPTPRPIARKRGR